jgi:hypothetical protein
LIALVILCQLNEAMTISGVVTLLRMRISKEKATELGFDPEPPTDGLGPSEARRKHRKWYSRAWRSVHSLLAPIDPESHQRRELMTKEEYAAYLEELDQAWVDERTERLDWICNRLIQITLEYMPREIRRRWKGSVCVDATPVPLPARGTSKDSEYVSAEPWGGWYVREKEVDPTNLKDGREGKGRKISSVKMRHSAEASILTMGADEPEDRYVLPNLVTAMALHAPGVKPDEAFWRCADQHRLGDLPINWLAGDRAYFPNMVPEKFQIPATKAGFRLIGDYRKDQLGLQEQFGGMILVDGAWYCPSMPELLINAAKDYVAGRIEFDVYEARRIQRAPYAMRIVDRMEDGDAMCCPAYGSSPTVQCSLKPSSEADKHAGKTRIHLLPEHPDRVCTNRKSITKPHSVGAKYAQELIFGSPEHNEMYTMLRQRVESYNGTVKDETKTALAAPGRRRIRGFSAQSLLAAIIVLTSNLAKIRNHVNEIEKTSDGELRRLFQRPRSRKIRSRLESHRLVTARHRN